MTSEEDARRLILTRTPVLATERVALPAAVGRFLAGDVWAELALPGFDNSSMDGYALRAGEAVAGAAWRITGAQPAGRSLGLTCGPGEAVRIFTGAPIPVGADAVVMQEEVERTGDSIRLRSGVEPGENIRRRGSDLAAGQLMIAAGTRLRAAQAALLASQGCPSAEVGDRARVTILSTGDELAPPGTPLNPGEIYESNGVLLHGLVAQTGASPEWLGIARDEPGELAAKLEAGLAGHALLLTGGVSVGERDLVKATLRKLGAELDLWRVAVKPGKPFLFGRRGDCAIFGLPGNPVSAFVTFQLFVRPALCQMMGARGEALAGREVGADLAQDLANPADRPHYLRGRIVAGRFELAGRQESHALFGLSQSDALLRLAPGAHLAAGSRATVLLPES